MYTLLNNFPQVLQVFKNVVKQYIYKQFDSHLVLRSWTVSLLTLTEKLHSVNSQYGCLEAPVPYLLASDTGRLSAKRSFFCFSVAYMLN